MKFAFENKKRPNRLMHGLIGMSLIIHLIIAMHISGIYRSEALLYIELTMQDISKSFQRSIPHPRIRHKSPEIQNIKKMNIRKHHIPQIRTDPAKNNYADNLMEGISTSDIPDSSDFNVSNLNFGENIEFITADDYFDMLRLKIENCKKYPEEAKTRYIEGRVKIRFVVTTDGQVSSVHIVKRARHSSLDRAALSAVKNASPFPRPPATLFKGPVFMEITIIFELT